jgi:hypothetical protein
VAEGIRIQARPELNWPADLFIVLEDQMRPSKPPPDGRSLDEVKDFCRACELAGQGRKKHFCKTYHIQLIGGSTIVSYGVWDALQRCADNPFEAVNPVANPPTQNLLLMAPQRS